MTVMTYSALNIRNATGSYLCPSCGFPDYFDGTSFDEQGPMIGTGICPCCIYQPGFDDVTAASGCAETEPMYALMRYSAQWAETGFVWQGRSGDRPQEWNGQKQYQELAAIWNHEAEANKLPARTR